MEKEKDIESILTDLNSRNRELECLYRIDEVLNDYETDTATVLSSLAGIISQAFRHSQICKVRVVAGDYSAEQEGFKNTTLKLTEDIVSEGEKTGTITVVYTKPVREEKGIFTANERHFLKTAAAKTGSYYYYKKLRETITALQKENKTEQDNSREKITKWLMQHGLNEKEVEAMLKVKIDFKKGETIIKQGAIASYIILLSDGLSKNYLEGFQERGFIFKIIKPLNFIGISALYGDNTFAFSGSALTNCTAYLVDSQLIKNLISKNGQFAKKMFNWYCDTTRGHLNRMSSLANKQSLGRFAEILLYLSEEIFEGPIITTNVSRKDIAELAAISTESGVRFLSDLKKDGILKILPNKIEILKPKVLKMIAG